MLLFAIYLATATWDHAQVTDTHSTMAAAWGLGTTGGPGLPASWQDLAWRAVTADGTVVSNRHPGATTWGALFYLVAPVPTEVARVHDIPVWPAAVAAATAAALAMAVLFIVLDRLVDDRRWALAGTVAFALGTPTWSVSADALWTHGPAQLGIALALLALTGDRWGWAGLALGAAMFARPQVGSAAATIGLGLAWSLRRPRPVLAVGLGALPGFAGLVAWSRALFDTWRPSGGYEYGVSGVVSNAIGTTTGGVPPAIANLGPLLLHPVRGVLLYTPWLWAALPGLRRGWRVAPTWTRWAALGGVATLATQLAVNPVWHGGDDHFGYRTSLEALTLAAPFLLLAVREGVGRFRLGRVLAALTALAAVVIFAAGSTLADPRAPKRQAHLDWIEAELGPNGEGYDPGTAVGPDLRER